MEISLGSPIPHDVCLGLEQAQTGANGVDVIDIAQLAALNHVLHGADGRALYSKVCPTIRRSCCPRPPRTVSASSLFSVMGFSTKRAARAPCNCGRMSWCVAGGVGDHHGIEIHVEQVPVVARERLDLVSAASFGLRRFLLQVGDSDHLRAGNLDKVANKVWAPVAAANGADVRSVMLTSTSTP